VSPKAQYLTRALTCFQAGLVDLDSAGEPGLVDECRAFMKRVEAAIELDARTETTPGGVRVVRRGTAGGRVVDTGCKR
jgi:hypothetical protein